MKSEEWLDVRAFEGLYRVSSFGRVLSNTRHVIRNGVPQTIKARYIGETERRGYRTVMLRKDGISTRHWIHRLVAQAFIPNPENFPQVNHKNGVKSDNHVSNLEWSTPKLNISHAWRHGLMHPAPGILGEKNARAKLKADQVRSIKRLYACGVPMRKLATTYGVSHATIWCIFHRNAWPHIQP